MASKWFMDTGLDKALPDDGRVTTRLHTSGDAYTTQGHREIGIDFHDRERIPIEFSQVLCVKISDHGHWFDAYLAARANHGIMMRIVRTGMPCGLAND